MSPTFADEKPVPPPADQIQEIIISGSRGQVRQAIFDAEDRFYARFNELNKDKAYDMECSTSAPLGTLLKQHTCEPKFVTAPRMQEAQALLGMSATGGNFVRSSPAEILARLDEMKSKVLKLVKSDPELQRLLTERAVLEQRYNKLCEKKCKGNQELAP